MFRALKQLIQQQAPTVATTQATAMHGLTELDVMAVSLMVDLAMADHQLDNREQQFITEHVQTAYELDLAAATEVVSAAKLQAQDSPSLHDFTQHLKHLGEDEKLALLEQLWRTAYADGKLDPHEEATLRKVADLLYISHAEFIQTKLAVAPH